MADNEAKVEKTLEQVTTDAAAREKRALAWQEKVELELKSRDEQWQSEMEDYYAKMVTTVKSDLMVELVKTVNAEAQAIRADIKGDVTTVGVEFKTTAEQIRDELRTELINRVAERKG
jgi:hypothetical protein